MRHLIPALALGILILATPARSADESPGANPEAAQTYELRGFFGTPANLEVSVRKPGSDKSQWVRVGEKTDGMLVEKADAKAGTATLRAGGATYNLRLMGASTPSVNTKPAEAVVAAKPEIPRPAKMDAKRREELAKRGQELIDRMSEEQLKAMQTAIEGKLEAMEKAHPEWSRPKDPAVLEEATKALTPIMREGLEAAAKLQCKDGKALVVPDDLEDMVRSTVEADMERAANREAKQEGSK